MQMDDQTYARYVAQAPELLNAVEEESDGSRIMRKDSVGGFCVKLEGGLCGIHAEYGDGFLSDACHFYPRITRKLGSQLIMGAAMSCPEIARLALESETGELEPAEIGRIPSELRDYLPQEMQEAEALAIHGLFLKIAEDETAFVERALSRIASVSRSLDKLAKKDWGQALPLYIRLADGRLPTPQTQQADPFNLLHALCGLVAATRKTPSERLSHVIEDMESALCVSLDWQQVLIHTSDESLPAYTQLLARWKNERALNSAKMLRRWLSMQLSQAFYPFGGLGNSLCERITIIGVRFATFKLALLCANDSEPWEEVTIRCAQSLSRLMDHLGDSSFSLDIYQEVGWSQEARLRGLINEI